MRKKASALKICVISAVLLAVVGLAYHRYALKVSEYATQSAVETLSEMAQQQRYNIVTGLEADGRTLANLALYAGRRADATQREMSLLRQNTHFRALDFFDTAGQHSWGDNPGLTLPDDLPEAGELPEGAVHYSLLLRERTFILMATPVHSAQGVRLGTLVGIHSGQALEQALLPFFEGRGYTYLLSENRELIVSSNLTGPMANKTDFWEVLRQARHIDGDTVAQMEEKIALGQSGDVVVEINGEIRYGHYQPVGIGKWCLITAVGEEEISRRSDEVMLNALNVSITILFIAALGVLYMLWQQHRHEKDLRRAAFYDEFCNCPNLPGFRRSAQRFMDEHQNDMLLLIKLDIDRFKLVNQTLGTEVGDRILRNMAAALRMNAGGDERRFARAHDDTFYILHCYRTRAELKALKHGFFDSFKELMGEDFHYKIRFVSGTYYVSLEHCKSAAEAIEKVTIAHRRAKDTRVKLCNYDETFIQQALRKRDIEDRMEDALERGEFQVYFQAQNSLSTGAVIGAEALVRWKTGEEDLYPDEFIPIFEENNFILQLDMYVFETVCQHLRAWMDGGLAPVGVSVNFARNHLGDPMFATKLLELAGRYGVPTYLLAVELTERAIVQDERASLQFLETLRENGFSVSVDDFGTGYSSLALLKNISVDVIKLDKSFFERADDEPRTRAVLTNVIHLAKDLHALTIAEGVETRYIADMLRAFGCDAAQGYYFAHPAPETEFRKLLRAKQGAGTAP